MAENEGRHDEKFDFSNAGEAQTYISLDQAVLQARRLVRGDDALYLERLNWNEIVWAEASSEQREDSYRVVLQFRRPARGLREEQTGEEEFLFDLTGVLQDRQVLLWPDGLNAGEGEVDTTAMPEPGISTLHPVEPPSIAEALTSPPAISHAETTEHRSEVLSKAEEGGAAVTVPDTAEVELEPTDSTLLHGVLDRIASRIVGSAMGLWGLVLLIGGIAYISEGYGWQGYLVLIGGLASLFSAILLYLRTKLGSPSALAKRLAPLCRFTIPMGITFLGFILWLIGIFFTPT